MRYLTLLSVVFLQGCIYALPTAPMFVAADSKTTRGEPAATPLVASSPRVKLIQTGSNAYSIDLPAFDSAATGQLHGAWCWAACIEAVTAYHGRRIPQAEVIRAMHGKVSNDVNDAGTARDMLLGLQAPGFQKSLSTCPVTWLVHDLIFDSPVLLVLRPAAPGDSGHVVVLTGMECFHGIVPVVHRLTIVDPVDGLKRDIIGPADVARFHDRMHFAIHFSEFEYRTDEISGMLGAGPVGYADRYVEMLDQLGLSRSGRLTSYNRRKLQMKRGVTIDGRHSPLTAHNITSATVTSFKTTVAP